MKIALAQTQIIWENKAENIENAIKTAGDQAQLGAKLILFPEMSFTGFSMNTGITKEDGKYTGDKMSEAACKNNISIGYGWVKDCGKICENHYSVVDSKGNVILDYAKIHPFSYSGEDKLFRGGEETTVFELGGIKFSVFICYDLRFPEIFQAVSEEASVIIVPACWPAKRSEHWKTLLRARAIENQVYMIGVNCAGSIGGTEYTGDSCVVDPEGNIEKILSCKKGILHYDFEDDVKYYRMRFPVKEDRRHSLYSKMLLKKQEMKKA